MTGALHQLKLDYAVAEDRLMLRVSTHDRAEVRLWFTRRFTRALWLGLVRVAEANPSAVNAPDPETRVTVVAFQHEKAIDEAQFGHAFEETATDFPLGEDPALVSGLTIGSPSTAEPPRLTFETEENKSISLGLDEHILHSLMRLLSQAMKQTDWDLNLEFSASDDEIKPEASPTVQLH